MVANLGKRIVCLVLALELALAPAAMARAAEPAWTVDPTAPEEQSLPVSDLEGEALPSESEQPAAQTQPSADPQLWEETPERPVSGPDLPVELPSDPADVSDHPTVSSDPDVSSDPAAGLMDYVPTDFGSVALSFGLDVADRPEQTGDGMENHYFALDATDYNLAVERAETGVDTGEGKYWYAAANPAAMDNDKWSLYQAVSGGYAYFTYLFQAAELSRVPDMEFDDWYVPTAYAKNEAGEVAFTGWRALNASDDATEAETAFWKDYHTAAAKGEAAAPDGTLIDSSNTDPDGTPMVEYDENWTITKINDPAATRLIKLQQTYGTGTDAVTPAGIAEYDEHGTGAATLPLQARWKASSQAAMTALSLSVGAPSAEKEGETEWTAVSKVYTQDPMANLDSLSSLDTAALEADDPLNTPWEAKDMWLWLDKKDTALSLSLETWEPYYSHIKAPTSQSPVTATFTYTAADGSTKTQTVSLAEHTFLPKTKEVTGMIHDSRPTNTPTDKARGVWNFEAIDLSSMGAAATVTVSVTSPDGENKETYTLHLLRRAAPSGSLASGNSPWGMIWRDDGAIWDQAVPGESGMENAPLTPEARRAWLAGYFAAHHTFPENYTPSGSKNQNGRIYKGVYPSQCWPTGQNLDCDPTAIFAYQDAAFEDPGVTFVDSLGKKVDLADSLYKGTVTRTIRLRRTKKDALTQEYAPLTVEDYSSLRGEECWYQSARTLTTDSTQASQTLLTGRDQVDLRGLKVLPGVYTISYDYKDPWGGEGYTCHLERKLVILPIPGDVDMDGAVTAADAVALRENWDAWAGSADPVVALARCRVFDVYDRDGKLTRAGNAYPEVDALLAGWQPQVDTGTASHYFYLPLPEGDVSAYHTRKTWEQVETAPDGGGSLELVYLGVETGTKVNAEGGPDLNGAFTQDPCGPWKADDTKGVALPKTEDGVTTDNSTFWMGVRLTDPPQAGNRVTSFSFSLIYDADYLAPASIYSSGDATDASFDPWSFTITRYNLNSKYASGTRNGEAVATLWSGKNLAYSTQGSQADRPFRTHYSKVISTLEQTRGNLRELVFTITFDPNNSANEPRAFLGDGYLLVAPFTLKAHPQNAGEKIRLVELGAGMRDFTLVTERPANPVAAALFGAEATVTASAFSAQDDIYGGATQNLREELRYDTASGLLPLGQDNTERTVLAEATYGESCVRSGVGGGSGKVEGELPPGLKVSAGAHQLTGTPLLVKRDAYGNVQPYHFTVDGIPYEITVQPKTLNYWPENKVSYYGEPEYRGAPDSEWRTQGIKNGKPKGTPGSNNPYDRDYGLRDFTFRYETSDLAAWDRDYAVAHGLAATGKGAELEAILGRTDAADERGTPIALTYRAPKFAAYENADSDSPTLVTPNTDRGSYIITSQFHIDNLPFATNYKMVEKTHTPSRSADPSESKAELSDLSRPHLSISARPVYIDYIHIPDDSPVAGIYNDDSTAVSGLKAIDRDSGDGRQIFLHLPKNAPENGPLTGNARVAGDLLAATFDGDFIKDTEKTPPDTDTGFVITSITGRELRPVAVSNVTLTDALVPNTDCNNYTQQDKTTHQTEGNDQVWGTVIRRDVTAIELRGVPNIMGRTITYGETLEDPTALKVRVTQGTGSSVSIVGTYDYNSPDLLPLQIHFNWVTEEEYQTGLTSDDHTGTGWDPVKGDLRLYGGYPANLDGNGDPAPIPGYRDNVFYPDMDGWRVCACVGQYGNDEGSEGQTLRYIKVYSDPITVVKRTIDLTPKSAGRYYGEELGESQLHYTFSKNQLAYSDQVFVDATFGASHLCDEEVLAAVLERHKTAHEDFTYTLPITKTVDSKGNVVGAMDYIPAERYSVSISGAESSYYSFRYTTQDERGEYTYSEESGSAPLTISPRPIVVARMDPGTATNRFGTIYADTKTLTLSGEVSAVNEAVGAGEGPLALCGLPEHDNDAGVVRYYTVAGGGKETVLQNSYFNSEDAILNGDELKIRYTATFLPEKPAWSSFITNYFDNDHFGEDGLYRDPDDNNSEGRWVQVAGLELTGADSGKYVLVFSGETEAAIRAPRETEHKQAYTTDDRGDEMTYLVSGRGTVRLRPIEKLELTNLGQTSYVYGDIYAPGQNNATISPMAVKATYAEEFENDPTNVHEQTTVFDLSRIVQEDDGTVRRVSTFADSGFEIGYLKRGVAVTEENIKTAYEEGQIIDETTMLVPGDHNGAHLFVVGRRGASDPLIYSPISDLTAKVTLQVAKRTLTVTPTDAHRFYGEPNPTDTYSYTFDPDDLAPPEQAVVEAGGVQALSRVINGRTEPLGALEGYKAPTYDDSRSTPTSPVVGQWGEYPLTMSWNGGRRVELTNYTLEVSGDAGIYVYPRPIRVSAISSSSSDPIFTLFNDTSLTRVNTQVKSDRMTIVGPTTSSYAVTTSDNKSRDLPITNTVGLVGSDALVFTVEVEFLDRIDLGENVTNLDNLRTRTTLKGLVEANQNYTVINLQGGNEFDTVGAAKLRTITKITLVERPTKLRYTYGENLDLTGLAVQVEYAAVGSETPSPRTVSYLGYDQFKGEGLYVNYWNVDDRGVADPIPQEGEWKSLTSRYRAARTGDHLTIAPTHDSQAAGKPFAANGKGLIISAYQAGENQPAVRPIVLGENVESGGGQDFSGDPLTIQVDPLRLTYTLAASDKTYDGDVKTAGTLTLTNVYDNQRAQWAVVGQASPAAGPVQDVVYVKMGAEYETLGDASYVPYAAKGYRIANSRVSFTTGTYTPNAAAPLGENGAITWTAGENYDFENHLSFSFANPNVHYVDETFSSGRPGVGTEALAQYWRADQPAHDPQASPETWDSYAQVSQLPVEAHNMILSGPDAANYTWGETGETRVERTQVEMETRAAAENGQAAVPYATIHKANRAPIQELNGDSAPLPGLQVDVHTNAVRLSYDQALAGLSDNKNVPGTGDAYRGAELHYEYALLYFELDANGKPQVKLWAGEDGKRDYQDTRFFGGEAVAPAAPAGYYPTVEQLPRKPEAGAQDNTVYQGQIYRWAEEDTGVSDKGYEEGGGFRLDFSLYPGGESFPNQTGETVSAQDAYWFYSLYRTARTALPRDTVFYPLVRLSETHNYHPSAPISGDETATAQLLNDAYEALVDYRQGGDEAAYLRASQALYDAVSDMKSAAETAAEEQVEADHALGDTGRWPEEPPAPADPAPAVKTYTQRMDLLSAQRTRSGDREDETEYLVETLESVWFTDTLVYEEEKFLSAVVYNHPTRYYGYYWDADLSARLEFTSGEVIDLKERIEIPIRRQDGAGNTVEETLVYDPARRTVTFYVQTQNNDGQPVRIIRILPTALFARLGDAPFQLEVATNPKKPTNRRYRWASSDPSVASVDAGGLVTFRGVGTAEITVYTDNGRSYSIRVTVSPYLAATHIPDTIFNFQYAGEFLPIRSGDDRFYPDRAMTRRELVLLLDQFLDPNGKWAATQELPYVDIRGDEDYLDALRRLTGAGVVVGVPGGAFAGEQLATRAELVTMVVRMLRLDVPDTRGQLHAFLDAGETETWAYASIDALNRIGVVGGVGGGYFAPSRAVTRQEAAAILARLLTTKIDPAHPELLIPSDVPAAHWAYGDILRAVNAIPFPDPSTDIKPLP